MNQTPAFHRDVAHVKPWAETCGQIRPLIEEKDGAAAEVHHLEITDAKLHYHERTDEIYYVIGGQGRMSLDGKEIEWDTLCEWSQLSLKPSNGDSKLEGIRKATSMFQAYERIFGKGRLPDVKYATVPT